MGLDPNDDSYSSVLECGLCKDILFNGATPEFVAATFEGIIPCLGLFPPSDPPNGAFILPQIAACQWRVFEGGYQIVYNLGPVSSVLFVQDGLRFWFYGGIGLICHDEFTNSLNCLGINAWGSGGIGKVFWGPQIGKEPIS